MEGNPILKPGTDSEKSPSVYFYRARLVYRVISEMQTLQETPYTFKEDPGIVQFVGESEDAETSFLF
jgi:hypothetical protein